MKAVTRILFLDEAGDKFFGEGPCRLLRGVEETGSLRAASLSMGMAYTKALKILKNAERALGFPLTERTAGGRDGGGSRPVSYTHLFFGLSKSRGNRSSPASGAGI